MSDSQLAAASGAIDVHAHFLPKTFRLALSEAGLEGPDRTTQLPDWDANDALELMDEIGIEKAILSISSPGVNFGDAALAIGLARSVNEEAAMQRSSHPGRFGFFASLPMLDVKAAVNEIGYASEALEADGVILLSNVRGVYLGDPSFDPIFAELDRRSMTAFIHPTSPESCAQLPVALPNATIEFPFDLTRTVTSLLAVRCFERHRGLTALVSHAGGVLPVLVDRIQASLRGLETIDGNSTPNVASELGRMYFDMSGYPIPRQLPALLQLVSSDHLLYGSDFPFTGAGAVRSLFQDLLDAEGLLPTGKRQLFRDNALRLFGTTESV